MKKPLPPYLSGLIEVGVMFLPGIPAYLWIWPNVKGIQNDIFQIVVYVYILVGTLFIGLRRYRGSQLGLNRNGIWLSLGCALVLLTSRLMIILGFTWTVHPPPLTWLRLVGNVLYYFCLVGLVEELLFRGLLYRLLEDWRGVRWAIWGSSIAFIFWHIFGQGPLAGFSALLIGLLFALLRWRGGGIVGLIVLHALWDLETTLLLSSSNAEILDLEKITIANRGLVLLGTVLLILVPVYVWKIYPLFRNTWSLKN